jgi:hypothetical protein
LLTQLTHYTSVATRPRPSPLPWETALSFLWRS